MHRCPALQVTALAFENRVRAPQCPYLRSTSHLLLSNGGTSQVTAHDPFVVRPANLARNSVAANVVPGSANLHEHPDAVPLPCKGIRGLDKIHDVLCRSVREKKNWRTLRSLMFRLLASTLSFHVYMRAYVRGQSHKGFRTVRRRY